MSEKESQIVETVVITGLNKIRKLVRGGGVPKDEFCKELV